MLSKHTVCLSRSNTATLASCHRFRTSTNWPTNLFWKNQISVKVLEDNHITQLFQNASILFSVLVYCLQTWGWFYWVSSEIVCVRVKCPGTLRAQRQTWLAGGFRLMKEINPSARPSSSSLNEPFKTEVLSRADRIIISIVCIWDI